MNFSVGNDIIEVKRIKNLYNKYPEKFRNRVFTQDEINYCESKKSQKFESYAARFAGKEAVFKAVSSNLKNKFSIDWKDIEITNNGTGKPNVILKNSDFKGTIDISLSHIKEYAIATAIAYIE